MCIVITLKTDTKIGDFSRQKKWRLELHGSLYFFLLLLTQLLETFWLRGSLFSSQLVFQGFEGKSLSPPVRPNRIGLNLS